MQVDRDNERRLRAMGIRLDKSRSPSAGVRKHVYEANKHRKVVDTEDVHNISRRDGKTGKVTSETVRTEKREVGKNNMQSNPQIPSIQRKRSFSP